MMKRGASIPPDVPLPRYTDQATNLQNDEHGKRHAFHDLRYAVSANAGGAMAGP
jgi:hypothetical protein